MDSQGTIKICDGIYVGDESSGRDEQLILPAHITLIVNLTDLPNYYEHYDIKYITQQWPPEDLWDVVESIDGVRGEGQSTLVHGGWNLDRPVAAVGVYLMNRFRWSLFKTIEYLDSKVQGLKFSLESFELLKREELRLLVGEEVRLSYNWDVRCEDSEQLVLRNTFLNSKPKEKCVIAPPSKPANKKKRRISWKIAPSLVQDKRMATVQSRSASLRHQVMQSVRKIINSKQTLSKHSTEISLTHKQSIVPSLTKHKSSYMFASLPSLQNMEKVHEIPVVTLQLSQIIGVGNRQVSSKKKAKTEVNEQNHIVMNEYVRHNDMNPHYRGRLDTQKIVSNSSKKVRRKQQVDRKVERPPSRSTILLR